MAAWEKMNELLNIIRERETPEWQNRKVSFYHYTSLSVLFKILEGSELWAANVRFSNDAMEERMLQLDDLSTRDDYIICFCAEDDQLSQWRGYCHEGGAAIKLNLNFCQKYSVLHRDFDQTGKYEIYENVPLPVVYLDPTDEPAIIRKRIDKIVENRMKPFIKTEDILPYMKNGYFHEEKEVRLAFSNINGNLSKCIRFRTLADGVKVPYMVVRYGIPGKMNGTCLTNVSEYDDDKISGEVEKGHPIWIEEGSDQETKYYQMLERIEEYKKKYEKDPRKYHAIKVFCRGRLPIEKITVAPTYDRDRKAEQIKRFCMSKYWLNRVEVEVSKIPYIRPSL